MSLDLATQHRLAVEQDDFQNRVVSALFTAAITAFSLPPLSDPKQQAQRLSLAKDVVIDPAKQYVPTFCWVCVSSATLNSVDALTDSYIVTTVEALFDAVAQQLVVVP